MLCSRGMTPRTSYHHGDLREALLEAGEAVLQERGLQGFTLRECARRAGVSHAAPKHHFGDTRGFLTAIAARGFDRLVEALRRELSTVADAGDLVGQFRATSQAYVDFALAWPEHFRIMFRCDLLDANAAGMAASARQAFCELTNVVLRQRGEPEVAIDQFGSAPFCPALLNDVVIAWSHVHGYAHLRLEQQLREMDEDAHAEVLQTASRRLSEMLQARDHDSQ